MREELVGEGLLENLIYSIESYQVEFRFQIVGLKGETRTSGTVQRKDGGSLTANIYRLEMRVGTTCRVMNNDGIWTVLSN